MAVGIEKGALLIRGEVSPGTQKTVAVDSAGKLLSVIQGVDGTGTQHTLLVDSAGQMLAALQGDFGGTPKTIAVDATGRMLADTQLLGASELDFTDYYPGCDYRFTIGDDTIKNLDHRIKACNSSLNVVRYVSAVGSVSAAGYYLLSLGDQGELFRGIGINESVYDTKIIKFGPIGADFDLSREDCTVNGMVVDMLLPTNRLEAADVTIVTGDTTMLDYDGLTYVANTLSAGTTVIGEISFPATTISSISVYGDLTITGSYTAPAATIIVSYYDGSWHDTTIATLSSATSIAWEDYDYTTHTNVTKVKISATKGGSTTVTTKLRDMTVLTG